MRIGIDIRKYHDYGIGTYIQNLMNVFQEKSELECVYYADTALKNSIKNSIKGQIVSDDSAKYSIQELFSISNKANTDVLDLFHSPHYTLPANLHMPSIVTIHDIIHYRMKEYFSFPKRAYAYLMLQHACSASSAIIVDSDFGKSELLSVFTVNEKKIHVIPLGVNQLYFDESTAEHKEAFLHTYGITKPYVLYTGSLKSHKNVPVLLKAFKKILEKHDLQLVFTGEKLRDNPPLYNYIIENKLFNSVFDLGRVETAELKLAYQNAAVVVLPSLYEGFGFSMLEAMASGVPAIGARATSITEVVGDSGLLFNPFDEDDLVHQIDTLLSDKSLRAELIKKGKERAKQFTWELCAERTLQIYKEVL